MAALSEVFGKNGVVRLWANKVEIEKNSEGRASVFDAPFSVITDVRLEEATPETHGYLQVYITTGPSASGLKRSVAFSYEQNSEFKKLKSAIHREINRCTRNSDM